MKLIADIGATNSRWLIGTKGDFQRVEREGFNPHTHDPAIWSHILASLPIENNAVIDAYLYGAGFHSGKLEILAEQFIKAFPNAKTIFLAEDMLGACRGMSQDKEGMVMILGTGSNSCVYDGNKITGNIHSLGFLLGDEGSATAIGKEIIRAFIRNKFPADLHQAFEAQYHLTPEDIISRIYQPQGNQYLGQFAKFAGEHMTQPYMHDLVSRVLGQFFEILKDYKKTDLPHYFTGSIAVHFKDIVEELCKKYGIAHHKIIPDYLDGLGVFHTDNN